MKSKYPEIYPKRKKFHLHRINMNNWCWAAFLCARRPTQASLVVSEHPWSSTRSWHLHMLQASVLLWFPCGNIKVSNKANGTLFCTPRTSYEFFHLILLFSELYTLDSLSEISYTALKSRAIKTNQVKTGEKSCLQKPYIKIRKKDNKLEKEVKWKCVT